jgi:hypothetical protein
MKLRGVYYRYIVWKRRLGIERYSQEGSKAMGFDPYLTEN